MKWNHRLFMIAACLFYGLFCLSPVSAEEKSTGDGSGKLTYEFNEIKVLYAAEFMAYPQESSLKADTVTSAVYGADQPIHVLYGVVSLGAAGDSKEEFIRVSEGSDFTRGLSNSFSWDNYGDANAKGRILSTEFATGKTLEGSSVVKDYSAGWKIIKLTRTVDYAGEMQDLAISFKWDLAGAADAFFAKLTGTGYTVDMASLKQVGQLEVGP